MCTEIRSPNKQEKEINLQRNMGLSKSNPENNRTKYTMKEENKIGYNKREQYIIECNRI